MKNCVYRFLDKDRNLLYIGKAKNLEERMKNHNHLPKECYNKRKTIEYVEFPTVEDMNIVERALIAMLKPPYNTEFKQNNITLHIMELSNLKWRTYNSEMNNEFPSIDKLADGVYLLHVLKGHAQIIGEVNNKYNPINSAVEQADDFDVLLEQAVEVVIKYQASASTLQRYLKIGFNRASRLIDQLEGLGIIGEPCGYKVRDVLIEDMEQAKQKIKNSSNVLSK